MCGSKTCRNDQMAFLPRDTAEVYLSQVDSYTNCNGTFDGPVNPTERIEHLLEDTDFEERLLPYTTVKEHRVACLRAGILNSNVAGAEYSKEECESCEAHFNQKDRRPCPAKYRRICLE
uniref:Uncharacterized protein n=2 Tax=Lotharella globosa TaxID=91324 RepID=A0A7S3Z316_9EUKA